MGDKKLVRADFKVYDYMDEITGVRAGLQNNLWRFYNEAGDIICVVGKESIRCNVIEYDMSSTESFTNYNRQTVEFRRKGVEGDKLMVTDVVVCEESLTL